MTHLKPQPSACAAGLAPGNRSPGSISSPTQDLRTLTIEQRRALSAEAERRARAGEAPGAIRAALGISRRAYASWAKLFGFRQCDLFPNHVRAGAPPKHPPGPGGYARSGRTLRGMPAAEDDARRIYGPEHPAWRGGPAAARAGYQNLRLSRQEQARAEVAALGSAAEVLQVVNAARAAGDESRADRLLMAWKTQARRARDLATLELAAEAEAGGSDFLSDEDLCALVDRLVGLDVEIESD